MFDIIVIGSGGAGLAGALSAASSGARVLVLESTSTFGGTTAVSGGSLWVPNNRHMKAAGISDSREEALTYLRHLTLGRVEESLLHTFVDNCNHMVAMLETETSLSFQPNLEHPDYQPQLPGAKTGGRTLQNDLFNTNLLGRFKDSIRAGHNSVPLTRLEMNGIGKMYANPKAWDWELIAQRMEAGLVGLGRSLVGGLLEGCLKHGVELQLNSRVVALEQDGGGVTGVVVERNGSKERIGARRGVILASGGFEWDPTLVNRFLGVPMDGPASPPITIGDGLRLAISVGAMLGNMNEAWWAPVMSIPGEKYEQQPLYRLTHDLRGLPGSIVVNRYGHRFVNEAMNYNDISRSLMVFDPMRYEYPNNPCYLIFDRQFRESYAIATVMPDDPTPHWLHESDTLRELAERVGIDPEGLEKQVEEFNRYAVRGQDPIFRRGESPYDRYRGDSRVKPNPNIRPLGDGPYYAVEIRLGCLGTKGGAVTDNTGQVIDVNGNPIRGFFAVGNAAASPFGPAYPGAGATLAAGMTFGYLAGRAAIGASVEG